MLSAIIRGVARGGPLGARAPSPEIKNSYKKFFIRVIDNKNELLTTKNFFGPPLIKISGYATGYNH